MENKELKLRLLGSSILRAKVKQVKVVTDEHREILSQMARLMYASSGVGLAATQVGLNESLIVVDIGKGLYKLINAKIIKRQGSQNTEEGCLSVPGVNIKVRRAKKVVVKALDEFGKPVEILAEDLLACVFQHELDHLQGRLIIDYASVFERLRLKAKLEEIQKMVENEEMPESRAKS